MWESNPNERSLPDWIVTAFDALQAEISERDGAVSVEHGPALLREATTEELGLHPGDAEYAIQRLLDRGYLYEVDGQLFVTEPTTEEAEATENADEE